VSSGYRTGEGSQGPEGPERGLPERDQAGTLHFVVKSGKKVPACPPRAGRICKVIPGLPHHIRQRGNRRQQTLFNEGDWPWGSARAQLVGRGRRNSCSR
jgi:hypothetical protein